MLEQSPNFLFGHSRFCERDSSGTTEAGAAREGDGAHSPTRASNGFAVAQRSGSPKKNTQLTDNQRVAYFYLKIFVIHLREHSGRFLR